MKINLRTARPEESHALTLLTHASKRIWGYPEDWISLWRDQLTVSADYIKSQNVFVAVRGTEIVGMCALDGSGQTRNVEHFWVAPQEMGQGIGRRLWEYLVDEARSQGVRLLTIGSDPGAEGFYLKMGARRIGEISSKPAGRKLPLLEFEPEGQ